MIDTQPMFPTTVEEHDGEITHWSHDYVLNVIRGYLTKDRKGRFRDDAFIRTSLIQKFHPLDEHRMYVHTLNSVYLLDKRKEASYASQVS